MNDEQSKKTPGVLHIPTCLGAVVLTYNLEGVPSGLKMTPEAAAGIFLGTIKDWDDPRHPEGEPGRRAAGEAHRRRAPIRRQRHDARLHRLALRGEPRLARGPGAGMSVDFPSGLGAKGNEGVAGQVASTPGDDRLRRARLRGAEQAPLRGRAQRRRAPS